eukprot:jgi/Chrzof1/14256/Cz08g31080.t1
MASEAEIDTCIDRLQGKKQEWASLPIREKVNLLMSVRSRLQDHAVALSSSAADIRGLRNSKGDLITELLMDIAYPAMYINKLIHSLRVLDATGKLPSCRTKTLPGGQKAVQVYPQFWGDHLNPLVQASVELYLKPGAPASQGAALIGDKAHDGRVAAVLGPGNWPVLGVRDLLVLMFECNEVCILKHHPLWAEWTKFADYVLQPLIERGYCYNINCGVEATAHLVHHPKVDHVHMIGGVKTHDILCWGVTPQEQAQRKAANTPLIHGEFTSELGAVTPCFIVPGRWTAKQLDMYAGHIAEAVSSNNSCNCAAMKVQQGDMQPGEVGGWFASLLAFMFDCNSNVANSTVA